MNPITFGEELGMQTLSDAVGQTTRATSIPIARAIVLNVGNALVPRAMLLGTAATAGAPTTFLTSLPSGVLGTFQRVVVDAVGTTLRMGPAMLGAGLGVVTSTVNAVVQTTLSMVRNSLNLGAAVLTLNPVTIADAAALGVERVAFVAEQTTIGSPSLAYTGPPGAEAVTPNLGFGTRTPSIATSILNGRQEIANAIFPAAVRAQAVTAQVSNTSTVTPALTAATTKVTAAAKTTTTKKAPAKKAAAKAPARRRGAKK